MIALIIQEAIQLCIPIVIENPNTSFLWSAPVLVALAQAPCFRSHQVDQCAYGTRWRKRTRLWSWHCSDAISLRPCCTGQAVCSFSNKKHIVLTGRDSVSGRLWTSLACAYPMPMAWDMARMLSQAAERLKSQRKWSVCNSFKSEQSDLLQELKRYLC